jgi:hypothetical protein
MCYGKGGDDGGRENRDSLTGDGEESSSIICIPFNFYTKKFAF